MELTQKPIAKIENFNEMIRVATAYRRQGFKWSKVADKLFQDGFVGRGGNKLSSFSVSDYVISRHPEYRTFKFKERKVRAPMINSKKDLQALASRLADENNSTAFHKTNSLDFALKVAFEIMSSNLSNETKTFLVERLKK